MTKLQKIILFVIFWKNAELSPMNFLVFLVSGCVTITNSAVSASPIFEQ